MFTAAVTSQSLCTHLVLFLSSSACTSVTLVSTRVVSTEARLPGLQNPRGLPARPLQVCSPLVLHLLGSLCTCFALAWSCCSLVGHFTCSSTCDGFLVNVENLRAQLAGSEGGSSLVQQLPLGPAACWSKPRRGRRPRRCSKLLLRASKTLFLRNSGGAHVRP